MGYLERNAGNIKALNEQLESGEVILFRHGGTAESQNRSTFNSIGSFRDTTGSQMHIGIKTYERPAPNVRLLNDLTLIAAIDEITVLSHELPAIFGIMVDQMGVELGIVMEDFSRGGTTQVDSVYPNMEDWLPIELRDLIPGVTDRELARASFAVERRRRLGDFNTLLQDLKVNERDHLFPTDEVYDRKKEFVVFVDTTKHKVK